MQFFINKSKDVIMQFGYLCVYMCKHSASQRVSKLDIRMYQDFQVKTRRCTKNHSRIHFTMHSVAVRHLWPFSLSVLGGWFGFVTWPNSVRHRSDVICSDVILTSSSYTTTSTINNGHSELYKRIKHLHMRGLRLIKYS